VEGVGCYQDLDGKGGCGLGGRGVGRVYPADAPANPHPPPHNFPNEMLREHRFPFCAIHQDKSLTVIFLSLSLSRKPCLNTANPTVRIGLAMCRGGGGGGLKVEHKVGSCSAAHLCIYTLTSLHSNLGKE
jgi:hypothetical protein